jgi:ribosomal-protein-alanine N-acetyltransferase
METFSTSRLILQKQDPAVMKFLFSKYSGQELRDKLGAYTDEQWEKELKRNREGYSRFNRTFLSFQLIDKKSGRVIGHCGYHTWYLEHRRAEIGYAITMEEFLRKGLMTEALVAILNYGFNSMHLNRVEAMVGPNNMASLRLMENFNFTREGFLRKHYCKGGVFEDSFVFSLLKDEYKGK